MRRLIILAVPFFLLGCESPAVQPLNPDTPSFSELQSICPDAWIDPWATSGPAPFGVNYDLDASQQAACVQSFYGPFDWLEVSTFVAGYAQHDQIWSPYTYSDFSYAIPAAGTYWVNVQLNYNWAGSPPLTFQYWWQVEVF
jgi:hypothetical protein